jgi:integrase
MPKFKGKSIRIVEGIAEKLEVPQGKKDVLWFDAELPGFGIRKFARTDRSPGKTTYFVKYNFGMKQRRLTLGVVVRGNLKAMRERASEVLAKAKLGIDVVAVAKEAKTAAAQVVTLGELIPTYLKKRQVEIYEKTLREVSYQEMGRYLKGTWEPLHNSPIREINRQAIVRIIDGLEHKVAADRARQALSGFFGWAIEVGYCESNPTSHIKARAGKIARERVLTEAELVDVWRACQDDDYGKIIKLLILTGQRRQEIGGLEWPEINVAKRQIELPETRTKNKRSHIVPLAEPALALLKAVARHERRRHVFGDGLSRHGHYAEPKAALDARIAARGKRMPPWVIHDLRRTFVTHISELGFAQPHVVEAIANHVSGAKASVAGVYNRAAYLSEKRRALEQWATYVTGLVGGPLTVEMSPERENSGDLGGNLLGGTRS